jgi:hypothetical protein
MSNFWIHRGGMNEFPQIQVEFLIWDTKVAPKILVTIKKPMDVFYIGISKIKKKKVFINTSSRIMRSKKP